MFNAQYSMTHQWINPGAVRDAHYTSTAGLMSLPTSYLSSNYKRWKLMREVSWRLLVQFPFPEVSGPGLQAEQ